MFPVDQYLFSVKESTPSTSICYNYTPVSFPSKTASVQEKPVLSQPSSDSPQH